jgi:nucleoside 2-deoxyribosyltransferase
MPFSEKGVSPRPKGFFNEVLNSVIVSAGNKVGFPVETAQQKGSDVIHTTIVNRLLDADLVIADLTDHNPNVLFELGIRLANDKPVALIRATGTGPIFDVDIIRFEDYDPNLWATTVKADSDKIADHIKASWDNRDTRRPYMEILRGKVTPTPQ